MTLALFALTLGLLALFLRGGGLHNHLVLAAEKIFLQAGYHTWQESPQKLPDGRLDFVDLLVRQGNCLICVEIETSIRNVTNNVLKASQLGLPLIILVPNRRVKKAVRTKLESIRFTPGGCPIYILLLSQLEQEVRNCFPLFSPANTQRKNRKLNQGDPT